MLSMALRRDSDKRPAVPEWRNPKQIIPSVAWFLQIHIPFQCERSQDCISSFVSQPCVPGDGPYENVLFQL